MHEVGHCLISISSNKGATDLRHPRYSTYLDPNTPDPNDPARDHDNTDYCIMVTGETALHTPHVGNGIVEFCGNGGSSPRSSDHLEKIRKRSDPVFP